VLAILLLAQTPTTTPPLSIIDPTDAARFDLATHKPREGKCTDTYPLGDEVLVCARMADMPKSLAEQAVIFEPKPFRPKWKMLGGEGGVALEQRGTIMGSAPAVMGTFKLKF
jgi:hypothetical protein